jgi:thioredoxin-like negative regulator of GroEL
MEQLSEKYNGKVDVVKVDVDVQKALAFQFDVMSIPTVILMKNGKVIDKSVGAKSITFYQAMIDKMLNSMN